MGMVALYELDIHVVVHAKDAKVSARGPLFSDRLAVQKQLVDLAARGAQQANEEKQDYDAISSHGWANSICA